MKTLLFALISLITVAHTFAANGVETFRTGLRAYQTNGADALLRTWYNFSEETEKIAELRKRLTHVTQDLGEVLDTEVFAPKDLGRHVQCLYGVIYFRKRPLWLRADYYEIDGRSGFLSFEFSTVPDDILPLEIGLGRQ